MEFFSQINQNLFLQIFHFARQNNLVDFLMVFGARYLIYIIAIVTFFLLFKKKETRNIYQLVISLLVGLVSIIIIDIFFYEPRPFLTYKIIPLISQPTNGSFPSLHTAALTILALCFIRAKTKYRKLILIPVIWTGFARVYTGVHYPLDILGGFIVGVLSVFIAAKFFQKV